ncbi:gamma-glutamyl-gamma-aminobutyrate hydrolase family protein [Plantactinospora sp. KLBMP9567]|uniref:gamma-glutamyl-gamma-aminobutyrate hydrolase family protein n=1 Tax=Plantactinospora sp. KLBMP9567 TaxID=3085900 RepID=UPI0029826C78|nr:gamma-glutamyl-gamma-aminobutyrate hydrolase family protein [Plantactinospora sp. KLBMP9567]MDW5326754.1 gamma-glutamyl-gamma-aminobutyrate hydrolase family protein [Plantactinospora sp. KLBMP9567]
MDETHATRNDALDQRWSAFLHDCNLLPVPAPNRKTIAVRLLNVMPVVGVLLTGGNDLFAYGGDAPERDETEKALLEAATRRRLPVLGVCRGMQTLQHHFGTRLTKVSGHAGGAQSLVVDGRTRRVNSYHNWAATDVRPPLTAWVTASDGVVKAVRHNTLPITGIMWHPERLTPFATEDQCLFRDHFGGRR